MEKRNKTNGVENGNNFQENPPARRDMKKEETIEVFLKDLGEIANLPEEHVYDFGEYFYLRGWRRNDVEEKYTYGPLFFHLFNIALVLVIVWFGVISVKEFLPFFGVVI